MGSCLKNGFSFSETTFLAIVSIKGQIKNISFTEAIFFKRILKFKQAGKLLTNTNRKWAEKKVSN